jgi:hypothetical protein
MKRKKKAGKMNQKYPSNVRQVHCRGTRDNTRNNGRSTCQGYYEYQ